MTSESSHESTFTIEESSSSMLKPRISLSCVTFSDETSLSFDEDEIVVFVGPNNAGKSATLREMERWLHGNKNGLVVKKIEVKKTGTAIDLEYYLQESAMKQGAGRDLTFGGYGFNINKQHLHFFDTDANNQLLAPFFCMRIATENRLTASNQVAAIALHQQVATHPIHLLLMDEKLARRISEFFRHAFGKDLFPFRAGGGHFPLMVGEKPSLHVGEDELTARFVKEALSKTSPLDAQGDGMRSFATVLLHVLVSDHHSIQFLDEPEAFLHPPQARLIGELIARERRSNSQLFIATHSTDVLDGLIAGGTSNVRIVRIQREGSVNKIKELSCKRTSEIFSDTLARYSGVFSGIFYEHVVVCESDADCLFYSSILKSTSVSGKQRADVLFIHAAGKHRMAKLVGTLRELDVPVSAIADIDILNEERAFRELFETLGGTWSDVEHFWKSLKKSIEDRRPPLNAEQLANLIRSSLEDVGGTGPFPKQTERDIKGHFKAVSPWDDIKRAGRSAISQGQPVKSFDSIMQFCMNVGLWIVPVGELEGFCRSIDGSHGPGFVQKVLEERDIENDPELSDARRFVSDLWRRAKS